MLITLVLDEISLWNLWRHFWDICTLFSSNYKFLYVCQSVSWLTSLPKLCQYRNISRKLEKNNSLGTGDITNNSNSIMNWGNEQTGRHTRNLELFKTSVGTSKECLQTISERHLIQSQRYQLVELVVMFGCTCIWTYVCTNICMYGHMYVQMYVHTDIQNYVWADVRV